MPSNSTKILSRALIAASFSFLFSAQVYLALTPEEANKVNALLNEGRLLVKQNKPEDAVEKFRAAKEIAPKTAIVLVNYGFALERTGKYDDALTNLTESIEIDPTIPIAWVNLAGLYQSTGKIPKAIETFEEYLKRFPKDSNVADARSILAILKATKADNAVGTDAESNSDYYSSIVRQGVDKWNANQFPLKVFISKGNPSQGYKESFSKPLADAFTEWQAKTNNLVSFVFVDAPSSADIVVNWTNDESKVSKRGEAGDCRTNIGTHGIEHAIITMLTVAPSDSIPLGEPLMHWVGLHEIGHALGVAGHSVNSNDIMYATMTYDYDKKGITSRDIATLQHLYQTQIKATGSPINMYNKATSELNRQNLLPVGQRNFLAAIAQLESIRIQFPAFDSAKAPLAYAYANQATHLLRERNFAEAAAFYKKSLPLFNKQNAPGTEAATRQNYAIALKQLNREVDASAVLSGKNP